MIDYSDCGIVWYAMKTTYKRELQAKEYLDAHGIENFIPMQQKVEIKNGRKKVVIIPAVHNLIFIKTDLAQLREIKISLSYIHNRLATEGDHLSPIIVPTSQMDQFIDVTRHHLDRVLYVDLTTARLEKGTPVRITDGDFKGYEGELEKVKGKRDRRVVVSIEGIVAYKFEVAAKFIEKI